MENISTIEFRYGFEYMGVRYGWKDKKLYRLPFQSGQRYYGLKVIEPCKVGTTWCFNVRRNKLTLNRLKSMTKEVNWQHEQIISEDLFF